MGEITLQDIAIANARIEEKLDNALSGQEHMRTLLTTTEIRLSALENAHARVKGFLWTVGGLGAITTFFVTVFGDVTQWFRH